tara:strand:- start:16616 stop:17242 length:627 start_codon:yes stop_codon:yes gene_type:complete
MALLVSHTIYKQVLGITGSGNTDQILSAYADSVSQLVKTYCNNSFVDFYSVAKTEYFNILYDQSFVQISEAPLVLSNITTPDSGSKSLQVYERAGISESYTQLTNTAGEYYPDASTDTIYRTDGTTGLKFFPRGPGSVKIVYYAGYAQIPDDLKLAVIDLITYYYKEQTKPRQTIAGASIQNQASNTMRNNSDFPDHIKRVLDLYKNY